MMKVLIAPLNWGLGHVTRCIPIIQKLLAHQVEVIVASDGRALALLKKEYPHLTALSLPPYQVQYNSANNSFVWTMFQQIPTLLYQIYQEHQQIQQIVKDHQIDVVISDNRFGCWTKQAHSIFITHQLFIQLPASIRFLQSTLWKLNQWFIQQYDECWIPDYPNLTDSLSGILAHQQPLNMEKFHFIGALSRLSLPKKQNLSTDQLPIQASEYQKTTNFKLQTNHQLLIVLSGPEPQRSLFEAQLLQQLADISYSTLLVRGVTESNQWVDWNEYVQIVDHLTSKDLEQLLQQAEIILSRAGYSTIMDLVALGKTAILVPTPDQTEQEYLGQQFMQRQIFYSVPQKDFDLPTALAAISQFKGIQLPVNELMHRKVEKLLRK